MKVGDKVKFKSWKECEEIDKKLVGPGGFLWPTGSSGFYKAFMKGGTIQSIGSDGYIKLVEDIYNFHFMSEWVDKVNSIKIYDKKMESYIFRDENLDFYQICQDAFIENKNCWLVIGNGKAYAGIRRVPGSYKSSNLDVFIGSSEVSGYSVAEITLDMIGTLVKELSEYSKEVDAWARKHDAYIKDRSRIKKNKKKFKVMTF